MAGPRAFYFFLKCTGTNLAAAHPSVGCCCCARRPEEVPGVGNKVLPLHIRPKGAGREPECPSHRREPAGLLAAAPRAPGRGGEAAGSPIPTWALL